jgi:zinc protease
MKNRLLTFLLAVAVLCPVSSTWAQTKNADQKAKTPASKTAEKTERETTPPQQTTGTIPVDWKKVAIPALPAFKPQEPQRIQLKNGMVIFLQVNHELPLISGYARIRGGSRTEPAAKVGLVDIFGDAWRTSGTSKMNGDQMDDYLEARAAKIETDGGSDSTSISFDCLDKDFNDVFGLFTSLLREPDFKDEKIELSKDQVRSSIARRNDSSQGIAGREAAFLAYGKDNPYVRPTQYWTVDAIQKADLAAWHKAHVIPNNVMLGIEGDFDPKQMEATLRKAFDAWPRGATTPEPAIPLTPAKPGIYVADKPEVNQSEVRMVELGIDRKNPDYFAVSVFNELFGGGFSSRLFSNLRTKQGLAYSVGGGVGSAFDHQGVTRLSIGTKTNTTAEAIKGLLDQIDELKTNPPTDAELKRAKDSVLNSFIFNFDTPGKVLREQLTYEYYGYPKDFLERYRTEVDKVTLADVNRVAQKYLKKDQLAILVVGKASEVNPTLTAFGPITKLDISIPTEPGGAKAAPKASAGVGNAEGKALLGKVVQGLGGAEKVKSVTALQVTMSISQVTPMGAMKMEAVAINDYKAKATAGKLQTPQGELTVVATPTVAFIAMGARSQDLPPSQAKEQLDELGRDFITVAQHADDPSYTFAAGGTAQVDGKETSVLQVSANDLKVTWNVDPQTGHVVRASYDGMTQTGPAKTEENYSAWKTSDGITLPSHAVRTANGKEVMSYDLSSFSVNPKVDPKMFEKPASTPPQ